MKRVFVDTSALYALLDADDRKHRVSLRTFDRLATDAAELVTTSYVLVETHALVQRRLGMAAVADLHREVSPLLDVVWVGRSLHEAGLERLMEARRQHLSLVDCVSLALIERDQLDGAFAHDRHFSQAGVSLIR